jgi:ATP-dependent helicase HrpA
VTGAPRLSYSPDLPINQRKDEILATIREHQVVVVAGETGSGKTTQLPKMCLELGRGTTGRIGHTQPRRIAARSVAERIAEETGTEPGTLVGWKVRFTDHVRDETRVKVMTDGILLAELQHDRPLKQYDTLIIDEAHERSLNIDFILGYLKQLLPTRPDLKVVITSATIEPDRFARHFSSAPVIEVTGRMYPVEVRYRPVVDLENPDRDEIQAICDAIAELQEVGPGDVLVFLSGEREIRDTADALRRLHLRNTEILPLYARLSAAEQHRVFEPHEGRRIILATNVAETSLTVPGIKYVVDPGTARISRYSNRLKVQRLPIEPISQASAKQRAGRCGRTSDGICIRLYSEEDFNTRPEFTEPEILRTNLAAVILQMMALELGDVAAFPFVDPPDRRNIRDGVALLEELGAVDRRETDQPTWLTPLGRRLARFPVDPRMGRMLIEAQRNGCLPDVSVIVAVLSIQDPRERPVDQQQAADQQHARFADKTSDFLGYLRMWEYLQEQQDAMSSSQFRRLCRTEFLQYLRVREWQDLVGQLRQIAKSVRTSRAKPTRVVDPVHVSLLAGLLSHIGLRDVDKQEYVGARGARFALWPGSALFQKPPRWVMAAELVETSRLWGRINARIDPTWVEPLASHLVQRTYGEPRWDRQRGAVLATEKVTLYDLPIVPARTVTYGSIDPQLSRELFIRHALVEGDWDTDHDFFRDNKRLLAEIEEEAQKLRRRNVVSDDALFDFYDGRIGDEVVSARHFDTWWKRVRREQPDLLSFSRELLLGGAGESITEDDFPDVWPGDELQLPLTYEFEPNSPTDGVTVHIPLILLNQVSPEPFEWQVPGLREQLVAALIRSLPKAIRRSFVPAPTYAHAFLERAKPYDGSLLDALQRELQAMGGPTITRDDWAVEKVPAYLRMNFQVIDDKGAVVARGKDLGLLQRELKGRLRTELAGEAGSIERTGLRSWTIDSLPRTFELRRDGHVVRAYPGLVDEGDSVAVQLFDTEAERDAAMRVGIRRLILLNSPAPLKWVAGQLSNATKLVLNRNPYGSVTALLEDCVAAAVDKLIDDAGGPVWDLASFARLLDQVRPALADTTLDIVRRVEAVLSTAQRIETQLQTTRSVALVTSLADLRSQLGGLVYPGFVSEIGSRRLPEVHRYLRAVERRLEKLPHSPTADQQRMAVVHAVQAEYDAALRSLPSDQPIPADLAEIRWMIEELRVSLFAQTLKTAYPVSEKRIRRALAAATARHQTATHPPGP